jgi:hypothetical protein
MGIKFRGETYADLDFNRITPGEVKVLERQVQMDFPTIQRALTICVCGHGRIESHTHKDDAATVTDETSCTKCETCPQFMPKLPSDISTTLMWLAIKRHLPTVTYREVEDTPYEDFADDEAEEPANPT